MILHLIDAHWKVSHGSLTNIHLKDTRRRRLEDEVIKGRRLTLEALEAEEVEPVGPDEVEEGVERVIVTDGLDDDDRIVVGTLGDHRLKDEDTLVLLIEGDDDVAEGEGEAGLILDRLDDLDLFGDLVEDSDLVDEVGHDRELIEVDDGGVGELVEDDHCRSLVEGYRKF